MHLMCLFTHVSDRHRQLAAGWHLMLGLSCGLALTTNPQLSRTATQVQPTLSQQTLEKCAN